MRKAVTISGYLLARELRNGPNTQLGWYRPRWPGASRPVIASDTVSGWLDRFFGAYYARRPVNATFIGVHRHDHALPDYSEAGAGDTVAEMKSLLAEATHLNEPSSAIEAVDLKLAQGYLETQVWEFESLHFHRGNPSVYTGEAIFGVMAFLLSSQPPSATKIEAAIARLQAIPTLLRQGQQVLKSAPRGWTERARRECQGARHFLGDGVAHLVAEGIIAHRGLLPAAGIALVAFEDFDRFLAEELLPRPTEGYAAGEEALRRYLTAGHHITTAPDDIARYAEAQLRQAKAALAEFPAPTAPAAERRDYHTVWEEARRVAIDRDLLSWPESPIHYQPRPAWAAAAAPYLYFLYYRSPAAFDRPAVHHYLVPPDYPGSSAVKLNHVVHHGGIGHHVQNWHAFQASSRIGQVAAVDCASRIALFCGGTMAEGWACYATDLMNEVGYLTAEERRDELATRCRMCARAVVDVRLHTGRYGPTEATDYYQREAGMDPVAAAGEVVKNSMFPGTALMYVMGTDRIHELRRTMSARLGAEFSLRRWHDSFLSYGSIPVSQIAALMIGDPHAL